jgi:hypothetical protein
MVKKLIYITGVIAITIMREAENSEGSRSINQSRLKGDWSKLSVKLSVLDFKDGIVISSY